MLQIDEGHRALDAVIKRYNGLALSNANEAETRRKVIDEILHSVLGWSTDDISYEERVSEDGETTFADYIIRVASTSMIVEAKRVGEAFLIPSARGSYKLGGILSSGAVGEAICQVRDYCRKKSVPFAVATNGSAWVIFPAVRTDQVTFEETQARVFKDLLQVKERFVEFWELLSRQRVIEGNLEAELLGTNNSEQTTHRLLSLLKEPGYRLGRNSLYEHIEPAVVAALTDEALLETPDALSACYIKSSDRVKYDSRLQIYLQDIKPPLHHKTTRLKGSKGDASLTEKLKQGVVTTPRFIVLLGPVGAGKTTFLHHLRKISAAELINGRIVWLHIDFKKATATDNPRTFIYNQLLNLIESDTEFNLGDWETSIRPAFRTEIENLKRGPLFLLSKADPAEFDRRIATELADQRQKVEPYVEKILRHVTATRPGFLIIDNVDQIVDDRAQQAIFVEAQAIARRINFNVLMSLRDATYLRHRNSPAFDAFQFDSFYVDPPQMAPVLSRRFWYAKEVLKGKSADIRTESGKRMLVKDLSVFFDIVSQSLLSEETGYMIEVMSGGDVRHGLSLVREFLSSGHTSADQALMNYISVGEFSFPKHEVFRGMVLGQRKYYREQESLLLNIYDSKLSGAGLQLLRLHFVGRMVYAASAAAFEGVSVEELIGDLHRLGVSDQDAMRVLQDLTNAHVIATTDGLPVSSQSRVHPTRLGGYIIKELCATFVYTEFCLLDTAIYDQGSWGTLSQATQEIESTHDRALRTERRVKRAREFLSYLAVREDKWIVECKRRGLHDGWNLRLVRDSILPSIEKDFERALRSAAVHYGKRNQKRA